MSFSTFSFPFQITGCPVQHKGHVHNEYQHQGRSHSDTKIVPRSMVRLGSTELHLYKRCNSHPDSAEQSLYKSLSPSFLFYILLFSILLFYYSHLFSSLYSFLSLSLSLRFAFPFILILPAERLPQGSQSCFVLLC